MGKFKELSAFLHDAIEHPEKAEEDAKRSAEVVRKSGLRVLGTPEEEADAEAVRAKKIMNLHPGEIKSGKTDWMRNSEKDLEAREEKFAGQLGPDAEVVDKN